MCVMADDRVLSVTRVREPGTILRHDIAGLVKRAVVETHYPGTSPGAFYHELAARVGEDKLGIFVGFEDGFPRALAVAVLPTSCMMMAPQVPVVYSAGRPDLIRRVGERLKSWIMTAGYDTFMGVNLWRDDKVFVRGFRHVGEGEVIGSLVSFKLEA
jgi:hypothetical protein